MIQGEASEDEIDSLEEASALRDIAHMPARVKCAVLGWRTLKEALKESESAQGCAGICQVFYRILDS